MNDLIKKYYEAERALYDHVGFEPDWVVYPIDDRTDMFWRIDDGEVVYAIDKVDLEDDMEIGNYYSDEIYTQRFYNKHIYRGKDLTMIFVDTHVDGNKFFAFFSNDKELKGG